ncbi:glycosyltransferase family 1 protein [Crucibulum laeve]|uniref:UDP-N-acetylglucosamine transferase subunit ALG13 n=1 Tax=Crucibulum laeve TaxID=68775 RepID=A0A5C3MCF5_9AGAR|nr:glycosyltransferase family 1 protein [Crucibulum laeve]
MRAFVTVGSTKFDALVNSVFSEAVILSLSQRGYTKLVVQCGNSTFEFADFVANGESQVLEKEGVEVEYWKFKPSLQEEFDKADLVISHAGSGTILDVLRLPKPLIVVPNPTLLDNHQEELATSLGDLGHLKATTAVLCRDLAKTIETFDVSTIVPFPPFDGSKFARIVDEEMGFI